VSAMLFETHTAAAVLLFMAVLAVSAMLAKTGTTSTHAGARVFDD
jgi:hypothetical protein